MHDHAEPRPPGRDRRGRHDPRQARDQRLAHAGRSRRRRGARALERRPGRPRRRPEGAARAAERALGPARASCEAECAPANAQVAHAGLSARNGSGRNGAAARRRPRAWATCCRPTRRAGARCRCACCAASSCAATTWSRRRCSSTPTWCSAATTRSRAATCCASSSRRAARSRCCGPTSRRRSRGSSRRGCGPPGAVPALLRGPRVPAPARARAQPPPDHPGRRRVRRPARGRRRQRDPGAGDPRVRGRSGLADFRVELSDIRLVRSLLAAVPDGRARRAVGGHGAKGRRLAARDRREPRRARRASPRSSRRCSTTTATARCSTRPRSASARGEARVALRNLREIVERLSALGLGAAVCFDLSETRGLELLHRHALQHPRARPGRGARQRRSLRRPARALRLRRARRPASRSTSATCSGRCAAPGSRPTPSGELRIAVSGSDRRRVQAAAERLRRAEIVAATLPRRRRAALPRVRADLGLRCACSRSAADGVARGSRASPTVRVTR